jgi:hypothetical protein
MTMEVAVSQGRGMAGRGWVSAWHGHLGLGRPRPQLAGGKTKYKTVECKGKHKFVCSVVVRVV